MNESKVAIKVAAIFSCLPVRETRWKRIKCFLSKRVFKDLYVKVIVRGRVNCKNVKNHELFAAYSGRLNVIPLY